MATANNLFRAARERTESLAHPGYCLTRQELAELTNSWIFDHYKNKIVEASANYICQVELGIIHWPGKLYREAFRAIFGVLTDSDLGFVNTRSRRTAVKLDNVKRKQFIHDATALGLEALTLEPLATLLATLGDSEPTPIPARVGKPEIDQINSAILVFNSWISTYGSGTVRETVTSQLRWSAGLLRATCSDRLSPELYSAVGYLANTAGFMAVEASAHVEARRVFGFGLYCAKEAKNWNLRAETLSSMVKQAIQTGQPDEGLTLAEQALVRADRLTATERTLLHTDRARTLVKMRRVQETLTAIGTADDHFAHSTPDDDPPFVARYNAARHNQLTGQALGDLAILGYDPSEATDRLTAAATGHAADRAHDLAICLTKLATLTMGTGDPLQAATIGHAALDIASKIRSRRTADNLRELARYAAAHQNLDEVAHLRHRIATLMGTGSP